MKSTAGIQEKRSEAEVEPFDTGSVSSRDGTDIGFRRLGRGPGLVVLHGAMESAESHMQLAEALASSFTVYLPDRRGRGLSGPFDCDQRIHKDVEDLEAVLQEAGAHNVMGISAGAIICLQAALTLPAIRRAAIFEPPLMPTGSVPTALMARFDDEIARGKVAAALVTGMKAAQMGPAIFNLVPRGLLELLTNLAMASEDKKAANGHISMRALAPTLHHDFQLIAEMEGTVPKFKAVTAEILLLGGSASPAYLRAAVDDLERVLPHATRVEFPGLGHGAAGNTDRGGKPILVAEALHRFFAGTEELKVGTLEGPRVLTENERLMK